MYIIDIHVLGKFSLFLVHGAYTLPDLMLKEL